MARKVEKLLDPTHSSDEVQQMPYNLETQEAKSRATTASWQ